MATGEPKKTCAIFKGPCNGRKRNLPRPPPTRSAVQGNTSDGGAPELNSATNDETNSPISRSRGVLAALNVRQHLEVPAWRFTHLQSLTRLFGAIPRCRSCRKKHDLSEIPARWVCGVWKDSYDKSPHIDGTGTVGEARIVNAI